nr:hypothetical protein [uncultured bacterium]
MSEEAQRAGGVFIPYPLLAIMMGMIVTLGGGIVGMYVKLDSLSTTLLLRDADYQSDKKQSWEKIEQLQVYINNDRERLIRLEEQQKKGRN